MRKFAIIDYVNDYSEINARVGENYGREQYIDRFNPFKLEAVKLDTFDGCRALMPITEEDAKIKADTARALFQRTAASLADMGTVIIGASRRVENICGALTAAEAAKLSARGQIRTADGAGIHPFFLPSITARALAVQKKDISRAHLLILDGGGPGVRPILWRMADRACYLSVAGETNYPEADDIFFETGLEISFTRYNKTLIQSADVVISTLQEKKSFEYALKRGGVYIDLDKQSPNLFDIMDKRPELTLVSDYNISYRNARYSPVEFEIILYLRSKDYRDLLKKGFDPESASYAAEEIEAMNTKVIPKFHGLKNTAG